MTATPETATPGIRSLIPARIDRLPWSRFHTRMVVALLEDVAKPLGVIGGSAEGIFRSGDPRQGGVSPSVGD